MTTTTRIERHHYDVVVIGAGGAGLRAAIEARLAGKKTAIISKSLFGKAHTVMAEGGAAAAMGNVNSRDNWQVHFRDTMRGGKFLNNFRMAELHAKEAPERIWELETYGALFDRTKDGKISPAQLRRPRVPAAGARRRPDRPGADPHPAAEDRLAPAGGQARSSAATTPGSGSSPRPRSPSCCSTATGSPARSATTASPASSSSSRRRRSCWPPAASAGPTRSPRTPGSTPGTATRWRCAPARR